MITVQGRNIPWGTLDELVVAKALQHGDAVFATISGQTLTYRQLEVQSKVIAQNLVALGVAKGGRVATLMFNTVEQVLMCFACARAGAVWVPINAALRGEDLTYTIRDSGSMVLVTEAECQPQYDQIAFHEKAAIRVFVVGDNPAPHKPFKALLDESGTANLPICAPSDTGAILYTGGTTGLPKGVLLSQFSFILGGLRYQDVFDARAGETHYSVMPLFHAGALHWALMGPYVADMSTVIDRRFSANKYMERVRECRANIIDPFGAVVALICQQPESDLDTKHSVRISIGVVQNLPEGVPELFQKRFNIPFVLLYGLTEGGGNITSNRLHAAVPDSNGKPYGWAEMRIGDADDMELPAGEVGEILLRPTYPYMFMQGYHNAPEQSLKAMRNFWLHTGDLGYVDAGGNLFFLGRKAHWLRRRGENISAYEIEAVMGKHPAIAEVVIVGIRSEIGEDDVKAFVIPEAGARIDFVELTNWTAERIAAFKVPRFIEIVEDFPRSATKREIERSKLKAYPNDNAWDREKVMGRMSSQART